MSICPGAAPVGATVTISGTCKYISSVVFLGPRAYIGSGGGGGEIDVRPDAQGTFSTTYTIPATYISGGETSNPPVPVTPGAYRFGSYPADICSAAFTVLPG